MFQPAHEAGDSGKELLGSGSSLEDFAQLALDPGQAALMWDFGTASYRQFVKPLRPLGPLIVTPGGVIQ